MISIDPNYTPPSALHSDNDIAGNTVSMKSTEPEALISCALVLWAGFMGQNIYTKGDSWIKQNRIAIIINPFQLKTAGTAGDLNYLNIIVTLLKPNEPSTYYNNLRDYCLRILINTLTNSQIWKFVKLLADELLANKTLSGLELENFYIQSGFNSFLSNSKQSLITNMPFPPTSQSRLI